MKKITFEISEVLLDRMDETVLNDGFHSRSEFLRFLIMIHSKGNACGSANERGIVETKGNETVSDEFADVDLEHGIPLDVIEKLKEKAAVLTENQRRLQS